MVGSDAALTGGPAVFTAGPSRSVLTFLVLERLYVGGGQPLAADAPMSAGKFLHTDPGDTPHRFAFDLHHHIGNLTDHFLLLAFVEDAFDVEYLLVA